MIKAKEIRKDDITFNLVIAIILFLTFGLSLILNKPNNYVLIFAILFFITSKFEENTINQETQYLELMSKLDYIEKRNKK